MPMSDEISDRQGLIGQLRYLIFIPLQIGSFW